MSSVKKYNGSWRATVKRAGFKTLVSHHPTKAEAEEWARIQETNLRRRVKDMPPDLNELAKFKVRDIVQRYIDTKSKFKGCAPSEVACLNKFLRHGDIANRSVASFFKTDAYKYRDERLQQTPHGHPITYRTLIRELSVLRHIWETAQEEWGIPIEKNPWDKIKAPPGVKKTFRRKRRLKRDEQSRLLKACEACNELNQILIPFAIRLTIETGMRLQEVMNLKWKDVNINNRTIEITKSKTDLKSDMVDRTIVMTLWARFYLTALIDNAIEHDVTAYIKRHSLDMTRDRMHARLNLNKMPDRWYRAEGPVFPPTEAGEDRIRGFKEAWQDVRQRALIPGKHTPYDISGKTVLPDGEGLTFHDLRHEAGSRFDSAGLTKGQHDLMMGHANRDMASLYIHAELSEIRNKLDAYSRHEIENSTLPDDFKDLVLNGRPKPDMSGEEEYFDEQGNVYILDKDGIIDTIQIKTK